MEKWYAGVWEQIPGFVEWSWHRTECAARKAAIKYAKKQNHATGGTLSWVGGVKYQDGSVVWYNHEGEKYGESTTEAIKKVKEEIKDKIAIL